MGDRMAQLTFSLLNIFDKGTVVCTAPTGGGGAGTGQGQFLAAITHQGDRGRVPLIGPAKGGFMNLIVSFDLHVNLRHSLSPYCRWSRPVKTGERQRVSLILANPGTHCVIVLRSSDILGIRTRESTKRG